MTPELWSLIVSYAIRIVGVVLLLVAALLVARWVAGLVTASCRKANIDETLTRFLSQLTRWVVLIVGMVMCLSAFGIQTTSFAAILGAAGLAIGLALQGTLSNFAAGVMLLVFRPFRVGDVVEVGGKRGKVAEIDIFFTLLDTPDNRRFVLPNAQVFGSAIENITFHDVRRSDILVGASYGTDVDAIRAALTKAAEATPGQAAGTTPDVVFTGFGASSLDWEVRVWSPKADFLAVSQACRREIKLALDEAGIAIPFPQLDVHLEQAALPS